jgi:mannose-1-phosphate guanylyltransferase
MPQTNNPLERFYSVIPAGGVGSRLWPLSRADAPKFLHDLTGSGQTLLRDTWDRLAPLSGDQRIMVVTGRAHRAAVEAQLPGLADHNVVLESEPKESSAAIGLAAAILNKREPGVIIGSFAADHVIHSEPLFHAAVREAVVAADAGYIVTIGIQPTEPAIGFGYIKCDGPLDIEGADSALSVNSFVEKPTLEVAKRYLSTREATCGTPACSSPAPTGCSRRSGSRNRNCWPGSSNSPMPGTPRPADRSSTASGRG